MQPRLILIVPLLVLPLFLVGCSSTPEYSRPKIDLPAQFSAAGGEWHQARPGDFKVPENWWQVFGDPELNRLEALLLINNQTLKIAEAQYRSARASLDTAESARLPGISAEADASRSRSKGATSSSFGIAASANWELDLWGRIKASVDVAQARAEASASDLAAARLSAQALLAQTWFQLQASEQQRRLIVRTLQINARFLDITRSRHQLGVASGLDVAQAEAQMNNGRAQLTENELQQAQLRHALTTLLGGKETDFNMAAVLTQVPQAPAMLPSTLLEQRPDIAAAERLAAAANAQIGLARTAYYPSLDLGASLGQRSTALGQLFDAPNRIWSIGPSLALSLFDGGARKAGIEQAQASYDQAIATYRQTVLNAFQEVQDNLATARLLQRESDELGQTLAAARRAREIAEDQYRAGTVSALNVINAQNTELAAERSLVELHQRQLVASVQLLKNAGGQTGLSNPQN